MPGSVIFEEWETGLINDAQLLLLTGRTKVELEEISLALPDAVLQVAQAQDELRSWSARLAFRK